VTLAFLAGAHATVCVAPLLRLEICNHPVQAWSYSAGQRTKSGQEIPIPLGAPRH
jgi:hypothetical protein